MTALQLATFYLDEVLWAVNVLQIREVIRNPQFSPLPQAPPSVCGLMNLRGQIVSVIDLGTSLGHTQALDDSVSTGPANTCVILKTDAELPQAHLESQRLEQAGPDPVGLLVQAMGEVVEIDEEEIDAAPPNATEEESRFIKGVAKLEGDLLLLLSLGCVLESAQASQ